MRKNRVFYLSGVILMTAVLAACSGGSSGQSSSREQSSGSAVSTVSTVSGEGSQPGSSVTEERSQERSQPDSSATGERSQPDSSVTGERSQPDSSVTVESGTESSSQGFTEEELEQMNEVSERLGALTGSEAFRSAKVDKRAEMALELLNQLADEGLVIRQSIEHNNDTISFSYSCGVLGGVMLREWDPDMN